MTTATRRKPKINHARILARDIGDIFPSPENEQLYRPVDPADPEIIALAESIREHGVQEPFVVTRDDWIISGHRRHVAAKLAGLKSVPCRVENVDRLVNVRASGRGDVNDDFMQLLREHNRQRIKTFDEKLREEVVSADPEEAYRSLVDFRRARSEIIATPMKLRGKKQRAKISKAKAPMLAAIQKIIEDLREFWPLTDRTIHYELLNDAPLIHASKPGSTYVNDSDGKSYNKLTELLTRARIEGYISMNVITDETRPMFEWEVYTDVQPFIRNERNRFLRYYSRDLMQSQPNHVEIIGEKNTLGGKIRDIAAHYTIPLTLGRGFCSLPPRYAMAERYKKSGKSKLVVLILSDFDPDGEEIAHSFARSMRDDFDIPDVEAFKVALTAEQTAECNPKSAVKPKASSKNYPRFRGTYGDTMAFELEALSPYRLRELLQETIDSVIDIDAFNYEVEQEKEEATRLAGTRRAVHAVLGDLGKNEEE